MIQRIQTLFWLIAIVLLVINSFQVYDPLMDYRNYQDPLIATLSGLAIILLMLATFSFHRRYRQRIFSYLSIGALLVLGAVLTNRYIAGAGQHSIVPTVLAVISLFLASSGTIALQRDIKLLEHSSRLR